MAKRQIELGIFIPTTSQHAAGWPHPQSRPQDHLKITPYNWRKQPNKAYLMPTLWLMAYR